VAGPRGGAVSARRGARRRRDASEQAQAERPRWPRSSRYPARPGASGPRAAGGKGLLDGGNRGGHPLWRRLTAELLGSGFLGAAVIGSGIAAYRLSPGDAGLELLETAAATAAGLFAVLLMVSSVSGGHLNPVVSIVDAALGGLRWRDVAAYAPVQVLGCIGGAVVANAMFGLAAVSISTKARASGGHFLSEIVATAGLLLVVFALLRTGRSRSVPAAVGAYIGAAYFFTSSTSFANPALTVGRMFSNTFAGIAPSSAPVFIAAQIVGGLAVIGVIKALYPLPNAAQAAASPGPGGAKVVTQDASTVSGGTTPMRPDHDEPMEMA
jgi:glycerol uptake facilitator-like aquaporin